MNIKTKFVTIEEYNNLIKETEKLKKINAKIVKTNHNLKRNKLRLKNYLNEIITNKQEEILEINKNHYIETNKLIKQHQEKIQELENIINNTDSNWEWDEINNLD